MSNWTSISNIGLVVPQPTGGDWVDVSRITFLETYSAANYYKQKTEAMQDSSYYLEAYNSNPIDKEHIELFKQAYQNSTWNLKVLFNEVVPAADCWRYPKKCAIEIWPGIMAIVTYAEKMITSNLNCF